MRTLQQYRSFVENVNAMFIKSSMVTLSDNLSLKSLFSDHPKLVVACRHGAPLAWLPVISVLSEAALREGGENRVPISVMDRSLHQIPLLRRFAEYITQGRQPETVEQVIEHMYSVPYADFVVFPEGSNCFFGKAEVTQPLRSPRFIEVALALKCPVLVVDHKGSESWAHSTSMSNLLGIVPEPFQGLLPKALLSSGIFTLPKLPVKIDHMHLHLSLWKSEIDLDKLSSDPVRRRHELWRLSEEIQPLFDVLRNDNQDERPL